MGDLDSQRDDPFIAHRGLLFTVAYEMLGSVADAEDVLQESWLRWSEVDHSQVQNPRAYLVRIVSRQSLNLLQSARRRREEYVGEWLPEPLLTSPDVADDVELAESVSIAMLTVLETLAPLERAVFVLREVFDLPYDEIAEAVGRSPAAVRQTAHRARDHVAERRPRQRVDAAEQAHVVERFLTAVNTGDVQALMDVLAPDVVLIADGGGVVQAARRPIVGARRLAQFIASGAAKRKLRATPWWVNGAPGVRIEVDGELYGAIGVTVEDGRIARIFSMVNPHKLAGLGAEAALAR